MSPFTPVLQLFLSAPDTERMSFLPQAHELLSHCPALLASAEADLDAHARRKKARRLADATWKAQRTAPLPGFASEPAVPEATRLTLAQGRPPTATDVVLIALLLRGFFGEGFKSADAMTLMLESMTLHLFFTNLGLSKIPGGSPLTELVNAISHNTPALILDAQIALVWGLGLDDFTTMLQDRTHVEGNSAWPTDSGLVVALVSRLVRVGASLPRLHLPALQAPAVQKHWLALQVLDPEIDLSKGTRNGADKRLQHDRDLDDRARRVHTLLGEALPQVHTALDSLDVLPSRLAMAQRTVQRLRTDLDSLAQVLANCEARVLHDKKVLMADKKLRISDPDVGFIAKGQRVPVIGYKPQLARSGNGFLTGLLLPQGNAADSPQLLPMVQQVVQRTGVVPKELSVDDGYASTANREELQALGIPVISINGSKGRALTAPEDWNSDEYILARDKRSAIESLMFTLKQGFDFGQVARRGLDAVYGELLEKGLAFNLCHWARVRRARQTAAKRAAEHPLALAA
jgi:Transposase DDE domain